MEKYSSIEDAAEELYLLENPDMKENPILHYVDWTTVWYEIYEPIYSFNSETGKVTQK